MPEPPLLRVRGLTKTFGAVRALKGVDLDFEEGQIHGLVGANGAGKSTLLNILGGAVHPDAGSIELDGRPLQVASPREAADHGFAFIWQELALVPEFSAIDNMTLPMRARTFLGVGDRRHRRAAARAVADRLGLSFDLERPVRTLSIADRGMVAIGRALIGGRARFVAMDEPTSSLSDVETERLLGVVRDLAISGVAVVYVTHRLQELEGLCDKVTVFKEGEVVAGFPRGGYTRRDLVLALTGSKTLSEATVAPVEALRRTSSPVLELRHISRAPRIRDISLDLHEGEILGLAGLIGAGRTEVARLILGSEHPDAGEMRLFGKPYAPRSVADAVQLGVALVPEERRSQGLMMQDSVVANVSLGNWSALRLGRLPFTSDSRARSRATEMGRRLSIVMSGPGAPVRSLSGGNQQKVVLARWFSRNSKILLLDEPTRGVDVGARRQIWGAVEDFAAKGNSVIAVCSELSELVVCHRVIVLVEGRDVGEIHGPGVTEDQMNGAIFAAYAGEAQQHAGRGGQ